MLTSFVWALPPGIYCKKLLTRHLIWLGVICRTMQPCNSVSLLVVSLIFSPGRPGTIIDACRLPWMLGVFGSYGNMYWRFMSSFRSAHLKHAMFTLLFCGQMFLLPRFTVAHFMLWQTLLKCSFMANHLNGRQPEKSCTATSCSGGWVNAMW